VSAVYLASTLLADDETKKSGPIGLAVILVLCIACYFLFKSMSKHLRRVREGFPTESHPQPSGSAAGSAAGSASASAPQPSASPSDGSPIRPPVSERTEHDT
jgi:hypothetical protein